MESEKVMEYRSVYKCRLCGEEYESHCTDNENIAVQSMIGIITNEELTFQEPLKIDIHNCKDGSYGLSDFCGLRKV